MPFILTYTLDDPCVVDNHGTLHVFSNGNKRFDVRIDLAAGAVEPLDAAKQKELAILLLRYAMQRDDYTPPNITDFAAKLAGKGIELDLVLLP